MSGERYSKFPREIRNDPRVIEHLIKCSPSAISKVKVDVSSYVEKDYSLIKYLTYHQLNHCFDVIDFSKVDMCEEIFNKLNIENREKVFKIHPVICFGYYKDLSKKEKIRDIMSAKYKNDDSNNCISDESFKSIILDSFQDFSSFFNISYFNNYLCNFILLFTDEELSKIMLVLDNSYEKLQLELKDRIDLIKTEGDIDKIANLSERLQVKYFLSHMDKLEMESNINKIVKLSERVQVKYFLSHMDKLEYASDKVILACLQQSDELSADLLLKHRRPFPKVITLLSPEEQDKIFSRDFFMIFYGTSFIDSLDLDEVMYRKFNKILDLEKRKEIIELYDSLSKNEIKNGDVFIYHNQKYQISRLLYDDNIVNNNDVEILKEYSKTYDKKLLIKILSNAYGDHVNEIFRKRPGLDLLVIDNFKIFDKAIYDKLGNGFVNHVLSCDLRDANGLIGKLSLDHELLDKFSDYFKCIIEDMEKLDANTIAFILDRFISHEEVIKDIDFNNITLQQKNNLMLLINDDMIFNVGVKNVSDLENYLEIRKKQLLEMCDGVSNPDTIKDYIFGFVFGRSISDDSILEKLPFDKALKVFNIKNIVGNEEIIERMGLSKDEVSMLLLMHEINRTSDINVLKDVFSSLVNRNLNSVLFANTFDKIKSFYIEDIKKELLTSEKLDLMDKKVVNGVEIVSLDGEEFSAVISVLGLNMSTGERISTLAGKELLNDWLVREDGLNNVSSALVSSDTSIYPVNEKKWSGFSDYTSMIFDSDIDVIGMGGSDISSGHTKRSFKHFFQYVAHTDIGFSTMDELKVRINKNSIRDPLKFKSEILFARREEDIRKDEYGKRVMPIGMYVVGEVKDEHLKTAKAFNDYYKKNGLGKFRIVQVSPEVYLGKGRINIDYCPKGDELSGKSI